MYFFIFYQLKEATEAFWGVATNFVVGGGSKNFRIFFYLAGLLRGTGEQLVN